MSKKQTSRLLTYQEASNILLPESVNKMYIGEVDGRYYWIKQNSISYIALNLSGGKPFPVRGFMTRVPIGSVIEYEDVSYLVSHCETSHIVLKKQSAQIKKAV